MSTALMPSSPTSSTNTITDTKPAAINGENRLENLENRLKNLQGNLSNYSLESLVSSTQSVSTCAKSVTEPVTPIPVEPPVEKRSDDNVAVERDVELVQEKVDHKKNSLLVRPDAHMCCRIYDRDLRCIELLVLHILNFPCCLISVGEDKSSTGT